MFTKVEACRVLSRAVMIYNQTSTTPSLEHAIAAKTFCTQAAFEGHERRAPGIRRQRPQQGVRNRKTLPRRARLIDRGWRGTTDVLSLAGARQILSRNGVAGEPMAQ